MTALFVRNLQPAQYEPARSAQAVVNWYAMRPHVGLWLLLILLPLVVLVSGAVAILHKWNGEAEVRQAGRQVLSVLRNHWTTLLTAGATSAAGLILTIVALHMITE